MMVMRMESTRIAAVARLAGALATSLVVAACSGKSEAPKVPLGRVAAVDSARAIEAAHGLLGPQAKMALDSGNTLFKRRAYAEALGQYRAAAALAPQHAAPLFGIYMVARATNNAAMADSALAGIRLRSGSMPVVPHSFSDTALQRLHEGLRRKPSSS
jgi:hypothetical protein